MFNNDKSLSKNSIVGLSEAPRPQGGACGARSGEQNVSQGNLIYIVPLGPAYPALAGRGTCRSKLDF